MMSAGVITANISWNATNTSGGMSIASPATGSFMCASPNWCRFPAKPPNTPLLLNARL